MDCSRAGCTGVLDPGGWLETEQVVCLQDQACGEVLFAEAGVEMTQDDLVDVLRLQPGMSNGIGGHADNQALDRFAFQFAESRVSPTGDASCHWNSPGMFVPWDARQRQQDRAVSPPTIYWTCGWRSILFNL